MKTVRKIVVAIPARNEEMLLEGCLKSVRGALDALRRVRPDITAATVVALDGCTDGSAIIATLAGVQTVSLAGVGVGSTRDAAITLGLSPVGCVHDPTADHQVWVACTDADSLVPITWLIRQVMWAESGMDLVIGTVEPQGLVEPGLLAAWHSQHRLAEGHPHVHGANLGMRADTWRAAGGFGPLTVGEDVALVGRAKENSDRWVATDTTRVATSARLDGRAHGGFAAYLTELSDSP